jgi:aminoglycoside phosphotransferase (APT) family kinase protein
VRGIDERRVGPWLAEHVSDTTPPFTFELIAGGRSNLTFKVVDADGRRLVVRRPPLGHVLATAHDMAREHRLIAAVGLTDVPVPPALALCTDDAVNGAPFYVMGFVDGVVLDSPARAAELAPDVRRAAAFDLIDVLAALHAIDVDKVGLGDLARRDAYVERQLKRWSTQWVNSKTRELPAVEEAEQGLRKRIPPQQGTAIVHGDYRLGNCLTDPETGRIAAVLDWELCTLGDPLADVGYLALTWTDEGATPARATDPTAAGGFPAYAEILARYAERTGRDVSDIAYYRAFAAFRLAVISEGVYARYLHGVMADDTVDLGQLKANVEGLADTAVQALREL